MTKLSLSYVGLNDRARDVYCGLLKHGQTRVNDLVKETGFVRQLVYEALAELEGKGLVNRVPVGKNRFEYLPTSPEVLRELVKQKNTELDANLSWMMKLFNTRNLKPEFQFYQGSASIRIYWRDLAKNIMNKEIPQLTIESMSEWYAMAPKIAEELPILKVKKNVKTLLLTTRNSFSEWLSRQKGYEVRLLQKPFFHGGVTVYGDLIHFVSYDKNNTHMAVVRSEKIAQTISEIFFMLWENTLPINQKL